MVLCFVSVKAPDAVYNYWVVFVLARVIYFVFLGGGRAMHETKITRSRIVLHLIAVITIFYDTRHNPKYCMCRYHDVLKFSYLISAVKIACRTITFPCGIRKTDKYRSNNESATYYLLKSLFQLLWSLGNIQWLTNKNE